MGKPIRSFDFNFVPMPEEIWDENIALSLSEFRFLGYLCKQIRFGEALEPVTDDEMMRGVLQQNGKRKDQGCGLSSRNGIKQAREALVERGWVKAENVSSDPTRPRWNYRLLIGKKGEQGTVSARQLVSQRDTVPKRQLVSQDDTAVSQHDSNGVSARQLVSQRDTCNKEEESTKNLDKELEKAGNGKPRLSQSERDTWDLRRWREAMAASAPQVGACEYYLEGEEYEEFQLQRNRTAAYIAGISLPRLQQLLKQFFPDDPSIDRLVPETPLFKTVESEQEIRQTIERSMPALTKESA